MTISNCHYPGLKGRDDTKQPIVSISCNCLYNVDDAGNCALLGHLWGERKAKILLDGTGMTNFVNVIMVPVADAAMGLVLGWTVHLNKPRWTVQLKGGSTVQRSP